MPKRVEGGFSGIQLPLSPCALISKPSKPSGLQSWAQIEPFLWPVTGAPSEMCFFVHLFPGEVT